MLHPQIKSQEPSLLDTTAGLHSNFSLQHQHTIPSSKRAVPSELDFGPVQQSGTDRTACRLWSAEVFKLVELEKKQISDWRNTKSAVSRQVRLLSLSHVTDEC